MNRIGRKEISIAAAELVSLMTDAKFQRAADDPMRLVFRMGVWSIRRSRLVAPLKDAVAFALQNAFEIGGVRRSVVGPSFYLNTHANATNAPAWHDLSDERALLNWS